jgi:hypothetical protein
MLGVHWRKLPSRTAPAEKPSMKIVGGNYEAKISRYLDNPDRKVRADDDTPRSLNLMVKTICPALSKRLVLRTKSSLRKVCRNS